MFKSLCFDNNTEDSLVTPTPSMGVNMDLFWDDALNERDDEEIIVRHHQVPKLKPLSSHSRNEEVHQQSLNNQTSSSLWSNSTSSHQHMMMMNQIQLNNSSLNDSTFGITSDLKSKCSLEHNENNHHDTIVSADFEIASNLHKRKRASSVTTVESSSDEFTNDPIIGSGLVRDDDAEREPLKNISNTVASMMMAKSRQSLSNTALGSTSSPIKKKKKINLIDFEKKRRETRVLNVIPQTPTTCTRDQQSIGGLYFSSIESALREAQPFDTLLLHEGIYHVQRTLNINVEGIHLKGVSDKVHLVGMCPSNVLSIEHKSITISHLNISHDIQPCTSTSTAVSSSSGTNCALISIDTQSYLGDEIFQIHIKKCQLYNSVEHGILVSGVAEAVIIDCSIHHCKKIGILYTNNARGLVQNNEIFENDYEGITFRGRSHPTVKNNRICNGHSGGVYMRENSHPYLFENEIFGNKRSGIFIANKSKPYIKKNFIHSCKENGIVLKNQCAGKIEGNDIYQNAYPNLYIDDECETEIRCNKIRLGGSFGIWAKGKCKSKICENEIFDNVGKNILITESAKPYFSENKIYYSRSKLQTEELRGIVLKDLCKPTFEFEEIHGHSSSGVDIAGRAQPLFFACKVTDNSKNGFLIRDYACPTINECIISNNVYPNILAIDRAETVISKCKIHSGNQTGISIKGTPTTTIRESEIFGNSFSNIKIGGNSTTDIIESKIYNGRQSGIWVKEDASGKIFRCSLFNNRRDNIFMEMRGKMIISENEVDK
ncbi:hypothetical protein FDP41_002422 [Naegleria fowleri]|uniref:Right handed beta helix domain-containing protein n=1 Tax=Naegleria fowleri TaxID=5763 RepID=A0A6A5BVC8_NAEFO|nr:uncharacterized protein FDP41_002422 [Naegleria fowleri]KAF0978602.1 hypothetical protein FDP41_002422 [Naegleria fowleri]CAG4715906.1 unnamed protein product [Naegleria fowleri]